MSNCDIMRAKAEAKQKETIELANESLTGVSIGTFKPEACFLTLDWHFTEMAHYDFKMLCHNKLREKQLEGKGYFIEASEFDLKQSLLTCLEKEDYASVANYAMMLATKKRVEKERQDWVNKKPHSSYDELEPEDKFF